MARPKRPGPWLDTRENGIHYACWYDERTGETKRISLRTRDSAEAQARFAEFLIKGHEIRRGQTGQLTVEQALDDYFEEHVLKNCADAQRQKDAIAHLKAFFKDAPVTSIDVPTSQAYTEARVTGRIGGGKRRKKKEASPSTVRRELNVLVAAVNHAKWMKRTDYDVQVDYPPEKRLGEDDEAPFYDREELFRIFEEAAVWAEEEREKFPDDPNAGEIEPFITLLYYTGARRRSIENLTRSQIRMEQKRIILKQPGKVDTKKRQPIVPILKPMEPALKFLLATGREGRLFRCSNFYRPYRELMRRAGIPDFKAHPHIMRHTRATHLLQEGKPIYSVARLLGDTLATVERVYGHHSADHLGDILEED